MKSKKMVLVGLVFIVLLILSVLQVLAAAGSSQEVAEETAVREAVIRALEANWNLLLDAESDLECYYDLTSPTSLAEIARERENFRKHYVEPAKKAGFHYTTVGVTAHYEEVTVRGIDAQVKAVVDVEYTSEYPGDITPILTKEADIEYAVQLTKQRGRWLIVSNSYFHTFSKRGSAWPAGDQIDPARLESIETSSEHTQEILGWYAYYNRSGVVSYADTWWNR